MWKSGDNLGELVLSYLLWRLNSACQDWQQAPLPVEPSHMAQATKALEDAQPCPRLGWQWWTPSLEAEGLEVTTRLLNPQL